MPNYNDMTKQFLHPGELPIPFSIGRPQRLTAIMSNLLSNQRWWKDINQTLPLTAIGELPSVGASSSCCCTSNISALSFFFAPKRVWVLTFMFVPNDNKTFMQNTIRLQTTVRDLLAHVLNIMVPSAWSNWQGSPKTTGEDRWDVSKRWDV